MKKFRVSIKKGNRYSHVQYQHGFDPDKNRRRRIKFECALAALQEAGWTIL